MEEETKKDNPPLEEELSRIDGIIEDLSKDETPYDEKGAKLSRALKDKKRVFIFAGLGFLLLLISFGVYLSYQLLHPTQKVEGSKVSLSEKKEEKEDLVLKEEIKEKSKEKLTLEQGTVLKDKKASLYAEKKYTLELKNFLFPYGGDSFLRVDVYCYYDDYESFRQAKASELILREAVYEYFLSKKDLSKRGLKEPKGLEEGLKEYLKNRKLKGIPSSLEVEGVILKS